MKKFGTDKRIRTVRNGCVIITCLVLFVFYFIYRLVFEDYIPQFIGWPMALAFVALGVVFASIYKSLAEKKSETTYYEVTDKFLRYRNGRLTKKYHWKDFSSVEPKSNDFMSRLPITFVVNGAPLEFNQFVDEPIALALSIIRHIDEHVCIDKEIMDMLSAFDQ